MRELQQNEVTLISGGCDTCGRTKASKEASQVFVISSAACGIGTGIGLLLLENIPTAMILGMVTGAITFLYLDGPKKFEPLLNQNTTATA